MLRALQYVRDTWREVQAMQASLGMEREETARLKARAEEAHMRIGELEQEHAQQAGTAKLLTDRLLRQEAGVSP